MTDSVSAKPKRAVSGKSKYRPVRKSIILKTAEDVLRVVRKYGAEITMITQGVYFVARIATEFLVHKRIRTRLPAPRKLPAPR